MIELFKKIVWRIYISECKSYLMFFDGYRDGFLYETEGDCCSSCYFEDILNIENLLGEEVIGIEKKYFTKEESHNFESKYRDAESIDLYGYLLKTKKGYVDIIYRNESNGYYGGWHNYIKENDYSFKDNITNGDYVILLYRSREIKLNKCLPNG